MKKKNNLDDDCLNGKTKKQNKNFRKLLPYLACKGFQKKPVQFKKKSHFYS